MGATRRSRWRELTQGSVINAVIRASGEDIDVHVISHAGEGELRDGIERRRPATLTGHRVVAGAVAAAVALPALTFVLAQLQGRAGAAERAPALPARRRPRLGRRRDLARARGGGLGVSARELVLHASALHVHDRGDREPPRARGLSDRGVDGERLRLARGPSCRGGTPCADGGREPRANGRELVGRRSARGGAADVPARGRDALAQEGRDLGCRRKRGRGGRALERRVVRRRGACAGARRPAGAGRRAAPPRRLRHGAARIDPHRGARGGRVGRTGARAGERSARSRSSPRSRTTCGRPSRASRRPSRRCSTTRSTGRRPTARRFSPRSTRRPTGSTVSSATCST